MEEKERYVIRYDLDYNQCLIDTEENQGVGDYIRIVKLLNQQSKQIKELEKQLAEKERQLKLAEELLIKQEKEYEEQLEKQAKIHYKHLKEKDQDKISFAIEQLEKVKENAWQSATDISCLLDYTELAKIIDNTINVLRNNKDGIH